MVVQLGVTPIGEFRWRAPVWRHDGISDVSASMDGAAFPIGQGLGRVAVGDGRDFHVQWTFAPVSNAHVFGLSYRAANVVHLSGIRGTVSWRAIPAERSFVVAAARIALKVPESAALLQDPWVDEAGWTVERQPHGMTASRSLVPPGDAATAGLEFTIDRMHAARPQ